MELVHYVPFRIRCTGVEKDRYFRGRFRKERAISSAGSEHYLDKVGVAGSNPALPTKHTQRPNPDGWVVQKACFGFRAGSKSG